MLKRLGMEVSMLAWVAGFGLAIVTLARGAEEESGMAEKWEIWEIADLLEKRAAGGRPYFEFIDVPALTAGVYALEAGAVDRQPVHDEDEIYYILEGRGSFFVDGAERKVGKGDVIYVKAHVEHRFFDIEEDLKVLVFFSTAATDG